MSGAAPLPAYRADQGFFLEYAAALALLTLFAFVQWAARGFVDPLALPWWLHLHAVAMAAWLALLVLQNWLALTGNIALHRWLGWTGLPLLGMIIVLGLATGVEAVAQHRVPPFWTNAFMLSLAVVQVTGFAALVGAAILLRRATQWHRRLMLGATIFIFKAALDRLLPLPLLGWSTPILEGSIQLALVGIVALHDHRTLRTVHPATLWTGFAVIAGHAGMAVLAGFPPFVDFANSIAS